MTIERRVWVARNESGTLHIFDSKPVKDYSQLFGQFWNGKGMWHFLLDGRLLDSFLSDVTFENSPQRTTITQDDSSFKIELDNGLE